MSGESIENITKSDNNFAPTFVDHHSLPYTNFNGRCWIKNNLSIPKNVTKLYISNTLGLQLRNFNTDFTLSLFGSLKLTENADLDKYKYTGYGIKFNSCGEYSSPDGRVSKNVIIFGVDMSSSVHIDDKGKEILILGKGLTQGLDGTTFITEALYPINLHNQEKDLYQVCTVMEATAFCLLMLHKYINSKQKTQK